MAGEIAAALSWTLDNIARYGGDPKRVVIAGHSSGGHLSAGADGLSFLGRSRPFPR